MSQYLLSTYAVQGEVPEPPGAPEEMQAFMKRVAALVRASGSNPVMTDGPFVEAKEHIAGFYIINADDLDAALAWAGKVVDAINHPIEVRPFRATGRVQA
jgi:hypothetical protein